VVALLLVIGLLSVYSSSYALGHLEFGDVNYFVVRQAIWSFLGLVALYAFMHFDYRRLRVLSLALMFLALLALVAVLSPSIGLERNGAARWIGFGPLVVQPSEFAKLALIVYISAWLASRGDRLNELSTGLIPFTLIVGIVAWLIMIEPDMGTTIILVLTVGTMFFIAGAPLSHIAIMLVGGGLLGIALIFGADYRSDRIFSFVSAEEEPEGRGYHTQQLLIGLGSGGSTGLGWGASRQKLFYTPGSHTDGVFAIIGEELGFVGAVGVMGLYAVLLWRGMQVLKHSRDRFGALLVVGVLSWIAYQTVINIGGITRTMPLTGVPLPFISYGGSALLALMAAMGILLNISRYGHDKSYAERQSQPKARPA
jgi:cell division protein FtsW